MPNQITAKWFDLKTSRKIFVLKVGGRQVATVSEIAEGWEWGSSQHSRSLSAAKRRSALAAVEKMGKESDAIKRLLNRCVKKTKQELVEENDALALENDRLKTELDGKCSIERTRAIMSMGLG